MNNTFDCFDNRTETNDIENTSEATMPPSDEPMLDMPGETDIETSATPALSETASKKSYFCSTKFLELLICFLPVAPGIYLEFHDPYVRPIPYQIIDGNIVNAFMYNQEDRGETVPNFIKFILSVPTPMVIMFCLIRCSKRLANNGDMIHKTCCAYAAGIGLTQSLTNWAKLYVGYFRPVFLDLCQPDENWECTGNPNKLHQGRVSFLSGHASMSFCGLLIFCYFLDDNYGYKGYKKSNPSVDPDSIGLQRIVSILCYAPMLAAYGIALSRVHDDYHHPADVVGGALLGGTVGTMVYSIFFG